MRRDEMTFAMNSDMERQEIVLKQLLKKRF